MPTIFSQSHVKAILLLSADVKSIVLINSETGFKYIFFKMSCLNFHKLLAHAVL